MHRPPPCNVKTHDSCIIFDTVGLVISPVKLVPDMTYNVVGGTLNLAQSIAQSVGEAAELHADSVSDLLKLRRIRQIIIIIITAFV